MKAAVALAIVGAVTLASGLWQGRLSHRWGESTAMLDAARRIEQVEANCGNWALQSTGTLDETALTQLECAGQFVRTYVNQRTGEAVIATLIVGPPGPTSVHRPEICLSSRNYTSRGERRRVVLHHSDGATSEFWASDFQAHSAGGELLRVCYAWSTGGEWTAPNDARFAFAGSPYLYKVQVSTVLRAGEDADKDTTMTRFLQDFLPKLQRRLVLPPHR
ncbi:MAG: hypothetical protein ABFC63_03340 [Thermoguttaceae bacterium]